MPRARQRPTVCCSDGTAVKWASGLARATPETNRGRARRTFADEEKKIPKEAKEEQQVNGRLDLKFEEEPLGDEIPVQPAELAHGITGGAELGALERSPHGLERRDAAPAAAILNAVRPRHEALERFQALILNAGRQRREALERLGALQ